MKTPPPTKLDGLHDLGNGVSAGIVLSDQYEYLFFANMMHSVDETNWMACVYRPKGEAQWRLTYRFRYDAGTDDPFDGADTKNWYSGTFPETKTDGELVKVMDGVIRTLAATGFGMAWRRVIKDRSFETLMRELKGAPFTHFARPDGLNAKPTTNKRGEA